MKEDKYEEDVYIDLEEICKLVGLDFNTLFKEVGDFMSSELATPVDKRSVYFNGDLDIMVSAIGIVNVFPVSKYWIEVISNPKYASGVQLLADTYKFKLSNYGKV